MTLASDVGGLVVLGVGVNMVGHALSKNKNKIRKQVKGWSGESERHRMAKYGIKTGKYKVKKVMGEFKHHKLHSGHDGLVTSQKQAIAIALSEQRKFDKERKEHPSFTNKQVEQIVKDHEKR